MVVHHRALSLRSLGTQRHCCWPSGGVIAAGSLPCHHCSATSTVLRHLGEPPPLAPCLARPPRNVGAYPGRHFPPQILGCWQAPCHRAAPHAVTTRERSLARARAPWVVGCSAIGRPGHFDDWPRPTVPDRAGHHTPRAQWLWAECEA
jgi:hypothetical protein